MNVKPYLYFLLFSGASCMAQLCDVVEPYIRRISIVYTSFW